MTAAQIPLTSLADDIAGHAAACLSMDDGPTVLVGHSYGGAVITGAADMPHEVKALVYITAFGLDEGESLESLSKQGPPSPGSLDRARCERLPLDQSRTISTTPSLRTPRTTRLGDGGCPAAAEHRELHRGGGGPAWKSIPSWYLVCTEDQMIPPPAQEFLAQRMGATVRSVPSSHAPFMSRPQDVAELIALAAETLPA